MSDDLDVRIATGFPGHPKTKRLIRRVGHQGAWFFMALLCWVRVNRPGGDLTGLTDEDLELAVDWPGEAGALIRAAREVGFIDGTEGQSRMHDWHDHNPWAAGSQERSERARFKALIRHHGLQAATEMMPAAAGRHARSMQTAPESPAPSPLPSPTKSRASLRSAGGPAQRAAPPPPGSPEFIRLPLKGHTDADPREAAITEADVAEWVATYTAVDVPGKLRYMRQWLREHPADRSVAERGVRQRIVAWLTKDHDKAVQRRDARAGPERGQAQPMGKVAAAFAAGVQRIKGSERTAAEPETDRAAALVHDRD